MRECLEDDGSVAILWKGRPDDGVDDGVKANFSFRVLITGITAVSTDIVRSSAELRMEDDCVKLGTVFCEVFVASAC